MKHWMDHTQWRENCDDCGEMTMVAVVKRGRLPSVRICRRCFPLGNWRRSTWHDARFHRIRANRLSKQLGVALRERDEAIQKLESAIDREVATLSQPFFRDGLGPVGVITDAAHRWEIVL